MRKCGELSRAFPGRMPERTLFLNPHGSETIIDDWWVEYNTFRPHRSLKRLTPEEFREQQKQQSKTTEKLFLQLVLKRGRVSAISCLVGVGIIVYC